MGHIVVKMYVERYTAFEARSPIPKVGNFSLYCMQLKWDKITLQAH